MLASICVLVANLVAQGFNVKVADATNTGFWNMANLMEPIEEMVLLAMPTHHSNLFAAERIQANGLDCRVSAIAKQETEVKELLEMGSPSFDLYREAREGLGREAINEVKLNQA